MSAPVLRQTLSINLKRAFVRKGIYQDSGYLGSPGALSGHLGLTPSGLEALTTHASRTAGRDYDQGLRK
jgi:hypothetical protein